MATAKNKWRLNSSGSKYSNTDGSASTTTSICSLDRGIFFVRATFFSNKSDDSFYLSILLDCTDSKLIINVDKLNQPQKAHKISQALGS